MFGFKRLKPSNGTVTGVDKAIDGGRKAVQTDIALNELYLIGEAMANLPEGISVKRIHSRKTNNKWRITGQGYKFEYYGETFAEALGNFLHNQRNLSAKYYKNIEGGNYSV